MSQSELPKCGNHQGAEIRLVLEDSGAGEKVLLDLLVSH